MDYSAFATVVDVSFCFGCLIGSLAFLEFDFLVDFIIKKKREIDEKRKKSKKGD